jgi:hypothetical protein
LSGKGWEELLSDGWDWTLLPAALISDQTAPGFQAEKLQEGKGIRPCHEYNLGLVVKYHPLFDTLIPADSNISCQIRKLSPDPQKLQRWFDYQNTGEVSPRRGYPDLLMPAL